MPETAAPYLPEVLVTGGQTGADRAAMDFALDHAITLEGFCPLHRMAEDGAIDQRYPLTEINGGYNERTERNLLFADATLIFYQHSLSGGTKLTLELCQKHQRPFHLIDIDRTSPTESLSELYNFLHKYRPYRLNIAGPRASDCSECYQFVYQTLTLSFIRSA